MIEILPTQHLFKLIKCLKPQTDSHLTAKLYVDNTIDEPSLVGKDKDNDFKSFDPTNNNSVTLNTQAVNDNQVIREAYLDQFHEENER